MNQNISGSEMNISLTPGLTCKPYSTVTLFDRNAYNYFNIVLGSILFVLGVLGNSIGIYAASDRVPEREPNLKSALGTPGPEDRKQRFKVAAHKKLNVNQYLLKWFFAVNLINSLLLILSPILKLHGAARFDQVWDSEPWITYIAHYNYPITKSLLAFGFLIYVIFFMNQAIAILRPFEYVSLVTLKRVNLTLVLTLGYAILWHLPTYFWFRMYMVKICPTEGMPSISHVIYAYDWVRRHEHSHSKFQIVGWGCYQVLRELFVNIIPFITVLVIKSVIFRRRNRVAHSLTYYMSQTTSGVNLNSVKSGNKHSQNESTTDNPTSYNSMPLSEISRRQKQLAESQQHKRTLVILTFEFVILILPVSLTQMSMDFLRSIFNRQSLATFYIFVTMLQFVYVSCTFLINFTFNPTYRHVVKDKLVGDVKQLYFKFTN